MSYRVKRTAPLELRKKKAKVSTLGEERGRKGVSIHERERERTHELGPLS